MTQIVEPVVIIEAREAAEEAGRLLAQARAYTITNAAGLQAASDERARIKQRYNEIEDLRKTLKAPILEAAKNVDDQFRGPLAELTTAIQEIDGAIKTFRNEQERIRREEEARLREEARKEQERLAAEARLAEARAEQLRLAAEEKRREGELAEAARMESRAEQQEAKADTAVAQARTVPTPYVPPASTKVTGIATRENWSFRITDPSKLPREYLVPNEAAIRSVVRGLKGATNIPGVEVFRDDIVAGTSRRGS